MQLLLMLGAALLPPFLLGLYIWVKDPIKEPFKQLRKAVLWGMAISVPVIIVELLIDAAIFQGSEPDTVLGAIVNAFAVAAIPEEAFKLLALWIVLRKNPYFDEHFDSIVYAVYVGLGFAALENVGYVCLSEEAWGAVAIMRALLAVPGHYAFAVLMGYYYALYHFVDRSPKNAFCILFVPVLAHGMYDSLAMIGDAYPVAEGIAYFALIYFCIKMHRIVYRKLQVIIEKDRMLNDYAASTDPS